MRFIIQRALEGSVKVDGNIIGEINKGYVVLVGISNDDTREIAEKMVKKLVGLRIFEDENGKTNLSIKDIDGELLIISQFTLYADCRHGNRPGFTDAGNPKLANELYEYIIELCKNEVKKVAHGEFGADMKVALINDGPFTIYLDSKEIIKA